MKHSIGMMQGRLTKPMGRGIQFFPFDNWEDEFFTAEQIGLDEIEWIFDYDNFERNPLWYSQGMERIKELSEKTGVRINAVCFDYFMRRPFFKASAAEYEKIRVENTRIIQNVLASMKQLKIGLIEIPLVDDSSLKRRDEKEDFREWLTEIARSHEQLKFGLETDLPPAEFLEYIQSFHLPQVGANYDSGNSSGIGYNLYEEVTGLRENIFNIHIKDRVYHGATVSLGTGDANFDELFLGLKEIGYKHSFILQAARGEEGRERENIQNQIQFLKNYLDKIEEEGK